MSHKNFSLGPRKWRFGLWCLHFPTEKSAISSFCRHYHHHLVKKRAMEVDKKSKILRRRRTFRESVRKRIRQEKPLQTYQISLRYLLNTYHHHRSRHLGSVEEKIVSFYNGFFLQEEKKSDPKVFSCGKLQNR